MINMFESRELWELSSFYSDTLYNKVDRKWLDEAG